MNRRWGRVVLPLKPNGRTGWINLHGLRTVYTRTWIRASLHARRIWLMRGSRPLASFSALIGAVTTPTPIGRFSVTDSLATGDPSGPFGWYAFGLSGHQPHLPQNWPGGDQLAIHGTDDPASIGTAASHGCLRAPPQALARLRPALHLGTPVVIMPTADRAMVVARASALPRLTATARPPAARPRTDGIPTALVVPTWCSRYRPRRSQATRLCTRPGADGRDGWAAGRPAPVRVAPAHLWGRSKARCASSAMYRAIASDEVAPGEGASRTCSARSVARRRSRRPAAVTADRLGAHAGGSRQHVAMPQRGHEAGGRRDEGTARARWRGSLMPVRQKRRAMR